MPFIVSATPNHSPSPAYIRISDQSVDEIDYLLYINLVRSGEIISSFHLSAGGYTDVVLEGLWGEIVQIHVSALGELRPVDAGWWDVNYSVSAVVDSNTFVFNGETISQIFDIAEMTFNHYEDSFDGVYEWYQNYPTQAPFLVKNISNPANLLVNVSASLLHSYGSGGDGNQPQVGFAITNHTTDNLNHSYTLSHQFYTSAYGMYMVRWDGYYVDDYSGYFRRRGYGSFYDFVDAGWAEPTVNIPTICNFRISVGPHKGSNLYDLTLYVNVTGRSLYTYNYTDVFSMTGWI